MCEEHDEVGISGQVLDEDGELSLESWQHVLSHASLDDYARILVEKKQDVQRAQIGFVSYGDVSPGDKVLIAVNNLHEKDLIESIASAIRRKGAKAVDILTVDIGEDRELTYDDEIHGIIRTVPWWVKPRWYDYWESIIHYALDNGYDMLIHGRGGPFPRITSKGREVKFKFSSIPWQSKEEFMMPSTVFPMKINSMISEKTWRSIYKDGRGGKVKLTDPEGTEIEFTLNEKYYEMDYNAEYTKARLGPSGFGPRPAYGHIFGHPTPPLIPEADAVGVLAGTTSHLSRPFPKINIDLQAGKIEKIQGGGGYGDAWRALQDQTDGIQYPDFPRKGLFWLFEVAIGTNPKIRRPSNVLRISSGGSEYERLRSGITHIGLGTSWRGPSEKWAGEKGIPYGHLHVHLLFPTYEIKTPTGKSITVIENGRLKALDDPEVRDAARKYGDPDKILKEEWAANIPGVNGEGRYEEYARDPAEWIRAHG